MRAAEKKTKKKTKSEKPRCGLCGATKHLIKTECCGNWICDDEHKYVLFSYATNSCHRNHRRYTLCGSHFSEGHEGDWKTCQECRKGFEPEMVAWYGTNEFNFEKMPDPPRYKPAKCSRCRQTIVLSQGGYARLGEKYLCGNCYNVGWPRN
jgi:hypothetical protein